MVHQDLQLAAAGRAAVEEALRRGRCGTDADSHAAPRRDPRARRDLRAARSALRRNGVRRVRGKCDVLGAGLCLYVHRPCVKLLYRSYSKTSGDSDALTSSIFPVAPVISSRLSSAFSLHSGAGPCVCRRRSGTTSPLGLIHAHITDHRGRNDALFLGSCARVDWNLYCSV